MSTKPELELLVKKLKDELRELRKEVQVQKEVELPLESFCMIKGDKKGEFKMLDLELNAETNDIRIVGEKVINSLHMATYKARERIAYDLITKLGGK